MPMLPALGKRILGKIGRSSPILALSEEGFFHIELSFLESVFRHYVVMEIQGEIQ